MVQEVAAPLGPTQGDAQGGTGPKIVHVFARFKTYSGAEHFCFRLAREAIDRGESVTLVTRHLPERLATHVPTGVNVRRLRWAHRPTRFHFLESICDVLYSPFLFPLVPGDSDWDVYWNDNTLASLFIDSFLRKKRRAFFCLQLPHFAYGQTRLVARSYPPLSWLVPLLAPLYRWLDRLFAARADRVLAISQMVRDDCRRVYGRHDIPTVGPGIDSPHADVVDPGFVRERLGIDTDHVLVTAGKIIPKKNFDIFVRVVGELRNRGLDVSGVIIGDGPLRSRIESLIASLGISEHCRMVGFVPDYEDVLRYMSGATVYLYLERKVPFGLTPLEAGSLGVPVVAFRGGGVEETVIDGENGRKLPSRYGPEEIADVLEEMLRAGPETLAAMGRRGREIAERWSWDASYDRFRTALKPPERRR